MKSLSDVKLGVKFIASRVIRSKSAAQIAHESNRLVQQGWRVSHRDFCKDEHIWVLENSVVARRKEVRRVAGQGRRQRNKLDWQEENVDRRSDKKRRSEFCRRGLPWTKSGLIRDGNS